LPSGVTSVIAGSVLLGFVQTFRLKPHFTEMQHLAAPEPFLGSVLQATTLPDDMGGSRDDVAVSWLRMPLAGTAARQAFGRTAVAVVSQHRGAHRI
jgi:hypothetical protein